MRCAPPANKPLPSERDNCAEWLERELALLARARVVVCLGAFAWGIAAPRPLPRFGHGAEARNGRYALVGSFHPSQQNTFTGKLTPAMMDAVLTGPTSSPCVVSGYAAVLRVPHVAALIAATLLARFPIGINALAIVLYLRAERGSFAVAGAVAGALAAGSGIGAPIQGRLVDAFGQRRVLVPLGFVHAGALGALVAGTEAGAPGAVLFACGLLAGFAIPPTSSVLRSMWPSLLRERPELLQPAYALDSVLIELIFVLGPLLTAVVATVLAPQAALVVSAVSVVVGTIAFTALPPSRAMRPDPDRPRTGALGALASPGVRTLVLTSLPAGVGIGICEVTLPAFGDAYGAAATAGILLAIWSIGSAAGGLVYGALPNRPPLDRVHLVVTALLPLGLLPLAAAPSVARDGAARDPGRDVHRAAARDPQRAGRLGRTRRSAHRGLHLAGHGLRGRDRDRLRTRGRDRRGRELANRVPRRGSDRRARHVRRGRPAAHDRRARGRVTPKSAGSTTPRASPARTLQ